MSIPSSPIDGLRAGAPASAAQSSQGVSALSAPEAPSAEGDEFHAMVEGSSGSASSGGVMRMLQGVDNSRKTAESSIVSVVKTGDISRMYDATAAMARFNLQTLVLNKLASKVGQAVDRLTNLQ
ncbi:EscI/YscI/HrpB family type III secretion system inner rod protein [Variovorax sp. RHLX14]|uniref:EscI/YscI/HrpB family type III secretion system inner rod protein n=1 Tax=Variovorax sp. RHLX14 TaxID=1259731 RepID=UPI003F45090E